MNWFKLIDAIALLIQLIAAAMMYLNSPNNTETGAFLFDNYRQVTKPIEDKRNRKLKSGFLLLVIGIAVSLISTIAKP